MKIRPGLTGFWGTSCALIVGDGNPLGDANENFNSQRAGAFITFPLASRLALTLAGGFNFVANDEFFEELESGFKKIPAGSFGGLGGITDGGYGNVSISTWF